ncbi:MAG: hypothetical protein AAF547_18710, partial [Actinomycetota bacterium]
MVETQPTVGQDHLATDVGLVVALDLANLALEHGGASELRSMFAAAPISVDSLSDGQAEQLLDLAGQLLRIVRLLADDGSDGVDRAAPLVNQLLERNPAQLHLTAGPDGWTLHHHRSDAPLVSAWSAVVAAALARVIGDRRTPRVGSCPASNCGRFYYDQSKNRPQFEAGHEPTLGVRRSPMTR